MQRIQYIDRLKGLAIILVVMGHVFGFKQPDDGLNTFIYTFHMPLFMFLSGLVISAPPRFCKILKKWRRFLVPFLVVGFACTFYRRLTIESFFCESSKGGYWYLWVLAVFYLLLWVYRFVGRGKKGVVLDILLFGIIYISFKLIVRAFNILGEHDILSLNYCVEMYPFFMLGYFVRKYQLLDYLRKYTVVFSIAVVVFIGAFVAIKYYGFNLGRINKLAGLAMLIVLIYLFSAREHSSLFVENQLGHVGRYSLEVYIFHYFFLYNLNVSSVQLWAMSTHNGLIELMFLAVVSVTIVYLSMCVGWIFHQEKWLQRIVYGG